jgi:hypothetical protein
MNKNLKQSVTKFLSEHKKCSNIIEKMMLEESFLNYIIFNLENSGELKEGRIPPELRRVIKDWIRGIIRQGDDIGPQGYNPDIPPNMPFTPGGGNWGDWVPPGQWGPDFHPGDPGPFWPGWGTIPANNPWHFDPQEGWKHVTIPLPKPGSPPPSVDLPEMLRHRYIQILNEKLKQNEL